MAVLAELISGSPPQLKEQGGAASELRLKYMVTGLTGTTHDILNDALETAGIPEALSVAPYNDNLLVVDRIATVKGDGDNRYVEIDIVYQRRRKVIFQNIEGSTFLLTLSGSLQEIETAFDANGTQISLQHTYAAGDPELGGETITQGGTVRRLIPQAVATFQGSIRTFSPDFYRRAYLGYMNSTAWFGDAAGTWLCMTVNWEPLDSSVFPPAYQFTFEFQWTPLGWNETAAFIDARTNIPPPSLVLNTGYKVVTTYLSTDFNALFVV